MDKIEISMEDLIASYKEMNTEKDEKLALTSAAFKSLERIVKAKDEEIYELQLTIKELKEKKNTSILEAE